MNFVFIERRIILGIHNFYYLQKLQYQPRYLIFETFFKLNSMWPQHWPFYLHLSFVFRCNSSMFFWSPCIIVNTASMLSFIFSVSFCHSSFPLPFPIDPFLGEWDIGFLLFWPFFVVRGILVKLLLLVSFKIHFFLKHCIHV